jgi:hypothetical protein
MTQVKKFWMSITFWTKVKGLIALFGAGGEVTLFMTEQAHYWHYVMLGSAVVGYVITQLIEDKNNNGIVDLWEKFNKKK